MNPTYMGDLVFGRMPTALYLGKPDYRKGEAYMTNYFVNRYGAIKNVDFSPILKEIMDASEVNRDE